jgi:ABC-type multidrug transport system ATPase subunit
MSGRAALVVRGLEKSFPVRRTPRELLAPWRPARRTVALAGLDLEVARGELVAVQGPNGAG